MNDKYIIVKTYIEKHNHHHLLKYSAENHKANKIQVMKYTALKSSIRIVKLVKN